jgi:hypothetical protein
VGARTVEHVKAFNDSLQVNLTQEDLDTIDGAITFNPLFPMTFFYEFGGDRKYNLSLTASDTFMTRKSVQIDSPPHQRVSLAIS